MNEYQVFADFYDALTENVDYVGQADRILSLFAKHRTAPSTLLDLACGSGSLCMEFSKRGIEMVGVDNSAEMLLKAREKAAAGGAEVLFLQQDMRRLDLYGTVEGAVCMLDSLNHLTKTEDVLMVFQRLSLFVEPGGLLIFDVNTPYKHRQILGNQSYVMEQDDLVCVWRNRLIDKTCEVEEWLDFFVQEEDGRYVRFDDTVRERAYSMVTLTKLLKQADFSVLSVYDGDTLEAPSDTSQRWLFVARNDTKNYG